VVGMLKTSTDRYTQSFDRIVTVIAEQASGMQQMGQTVTEIRGRTRELSAVLGSRARREGDADLSQLALQIAAMQAAHLQHAEALGHVATQLLELGHPAPQSAPVLEKA
jgi:hypothetical protein